MIAAAAVGLLVLLEIVGEVLLDVVGLRLLPVHRDEHLAEFLALLRDLFLRELHLHFPFVSWREVSDTSRQ